MTILVCEPRTGSTLLSGNLETKYKQQGVDCYGELFLDRFNLVDDIMIEVSSKGKIDSIDNIIKKIQWITLRKSSGIPSFFKVMTLQMGKELEEITSTFLKNENIFTINRNPFDTFLSFSFQRQTRWKIAHNLKHINIEKTRYTIPNHFVSYWIDTHIQFKKFISKQTNVTEIKYEDVCKLKHQCMLPMNIDYSQCINNYDAIKFLFDYTMELKQCGAQTIEKEI
jgi:hypothetical protein